MRRNSWRKSVPTTLLPAALLASGVSGAAVRQERTLVPISAQLELTLPVFAQLQLILFPNITQLNPWMCPKLLKLNSNVSDVS